MEGFAARLAGRAEGKIDAGGGRGDILFADRVHHRALDRGAALDTLQRLKRLLALGIAGSHFERVGLGIGRANAGED